MNPTTTAKAPQAPAASDSMSLTKRELVELLHQQTVANRELVKLNTSLKETVAYQAIRLTNAKKCFVELRERCRKYEARLGKEVT